MINVRTLFAAGAVAVGWLACALPALAADTLYKRLGGYDAIAGFVDTAFPRVASNPQLTHLFRGHSIESQRRQRQLIVDALCEATGGPCLYTGRDMKPVHVGLGITGEQWNTFMSIISSAAAERKFGEAERKEFLALFAQRFRPDVVEKP
jgi:hemoglobin